MCIKTHPYFDISQEKHHIIVNFAPQMRLHLIISVLAGSHQKAKNNSAFFFTTFSTPYASLAPTLSDIPKRVTDRLITFYQSKTPSAENPVFTKLLLFSFRWTCHCTTDIIVVAYGGRRHIADIAIRGLGISRSVLGYFYLKGMLFSVSQSAMSSLNLLPYICWTVTWYGY